MISITALSTTPVKGTRLHRVGEVDLRSDGASGDRRFFVIDARGRMVNAKRLGALQQVLADSVDGELRLKFPSGQVAEAEVDLGEPLTVQFYSRQREARLVRGPFADALSEHVGEPLRLVAPSTGAVDRGRSGGVSLISQASLSALAAAAAKDAVDARRFRMLLEIDGVDAHGEDRWVGRRARVGETLVRFRGHVGRCLITSRDPDTGVVDLPTLDILRDYRGEVETTEPLPFGIYGEVVEEGVVRVGDVLEIVD